MVNAQRVLFDACAQRFLFSVTGLVTMRLQVQTSLQAVAFSYPLGSAPSPGHKVKHCIRGWYVLVFAMLFTAFSSNPAVAEGRLCVCVCVCIYIVITHFVIL